MTPICVAIPLPNEKDQEACYIPPAHTADKGRSYFKSDAAKRQTRLHRRLPAKSAPELAIFFFFDLFFPHPKSEDAEARPRLERTECYCSGQAGSRRAYYLLLLCLLPTRNFLIDDGASFFCTAVAGRIGKKEDSFGTGGRRGEFRFRLAWSLCLWCAATAELSKYPTLYGCSAKVNAALTRATQRDRETPRRSQARRNK